MKKPPSVLPNRRPLFHSSFKRGFFSSSEQDCGCFRDTYVSHPNSAGPQLSTSYVCMVHTYTQDSHPEIAKFNTNLSSQEMMDTLVACLIRGLWMREAPSRSGRMQGDKRVWQGAASPPGRPAKDKTWGGSFRRNGLC